MSESANSTTIEPSLPTKMRLRHHKDHDHPNLLQDIFLYSTIFTSASTSTLLSSYLTAHPYPHGRITNLFLPSFLSSVLHELKHSSNVKFKESDLFRMYQSFSLVSLPHDGAMPYLYQLMTTLISSSFRSFIESITGLPTNTLTNQVDCAANCHTNGCHLLCHDDVINTRCISYVIYLTESEYEWNDEYGGRLELYDGDVNTIPCKTILPTWNSMVYFRVRAGCSFHSVQEVFVNDRPRLSIQGEWKRAVICDSSSEVLCVSSFRWCKSVSWMWFDCIRNVIM